MNVNNRLKTYRLRESIHEEENRNVKWVRNSRIFFKLLANTLQLRRQMQGEGRKSKNANWFVEVGMVLLLGSLHVHSSSYLNGWFTNLNLNLLVIHRCRKDGRWRVEDKQLVDFWKTLRSQKLEIRMRRKADEEGGEKNNFQLTIVFFKWKKILINENV